MERLCDNTLALVLEKLSYPADRKNVSLASKRIRRIACSTMTGRIVFSSKNNINNNIDLGLVFPAIDEVHLCHASAIDNLAAIERNPTLFRRARTLVVSSLDVSVLAKLPLEEMTQLETFSVGRSGVRITWREFDRSLRHAIRDVVAASSSQVARFDVDAFHVLQEMSAFSCNPNVPLEAAALAMASLPSALMTKVMFPHLAIAEMFGWMSDVFLWHLDSIHGSSTSTCFPRSLLRRCPNLVL